MKKEKNERNLLPRYYLGIDGGGTKTAFKLVDENGVPISIISKGPSNPNDVGMERAFSVLGEGIAEACGEIPHSQITMFAGLAGGGMSGDNAEILRQFFKDFSFLAFENGSDIENLAALSDGEKRILVIMGTGFIVYAISKTERKRIAGWGQLFDEGGSGYSIGKDVVTAVLSESDGSGKHTLLTKLIEERIGETAESHLTKFYQGGKRYIAEFARLAFLAAESNDPVALSILEKNMRFTADKINAALSFLTETPSLTDIPILFAGGISQKSEMLFPMIEKHLPPHKCPLSLIKKEPVDGAVKRAKQIFEAITKENAVL